MADEPPRADVCRRNRADGLGRLNHIPGGVLPALLSRLVGGIEDLFKYYSDVVWYEKSVASATHPYASPWWSWPLMLRPIAYWQNFPKAGDVQTVWAVAILSCGGAR